jgi:hypothetical protein
MPAYAKPFRMASSHTRQRGTTRAADVTAHRDHTPISHQDPCRRGRADRRVILMLLVEGLGAAVDGAHVKDEILAFPPGLVDECADEAGTDAAALMTGADCRDQIYLNNDGPI